MLVLKEQNPPTSNLRNFTNKPEVRFTNILDALKDFTIVENSVQITKTQLKDLGTHNELMIDFLAKCYDSWVEHKIACLSDDTFGNETNGLIPYNITTNYVNHKQIVQSLEYFRQIGLWCTDQITPIFANTWNQVLSSASNGYVVPQYIKQGFNRIYCLNINPGHHAASSRYGGYCYLNNGAICAQSLLNDPELGYSKVAILDLDYHAGDGTAQIFQYNSNVLTISIHINPLYDYPYYSGHPEENTQTNYNFVFEPGCNLMQYLELINASMEKIKDFSPNALIIAFGGDTYKNDLDAIEINRTQIDIADYKKIGQNIICGFGTINPIPIIITQEGGYNMDNIGLIVQSFLSGLV